jgi:Tol biopolymer transport system component
LEKNAMSKLDRNRALAAIAVAAAALALPAAPGGSAAGATKTSAKIAFIRHSLFAPYSSHIYVMNPDGGDLRQVTYGDSRDSGQRWSPVGSRIVFERWTTLTEADIFVVAADGRGLRRLTSDPGIELSPAWSPGGRRIAYGTETGLFVMKADGSGKRQITSRKHTKDSWTGDVSWSPDGRRIAFTTERGTVSVVAADGHGKRLLTRGGPGGVCPAWSPDGRSVAYAGGTRGARYSSIYVARLHQLAARARVLTRHAYTEDGGFAWAPGGRRILYAREAGGGVYRIDVDGRHDRRLTRNPLRRDGWAGGFGWSPDRQRIAYASDRSGNGDIYVMDPRGSEQLQLTARPGGRRSSALVALAAHRIVLNHVGRLEER